jgi:hypothetical protein
MPPRLQETANKVADWTKGTCTTTRGHSPALTFLRTTAKAVLGWAGRQYPAKEKHRLRSSRYAWDSQPRPAKRKEDKRQVICPQLAESKCYPATPGERQRNTCRGRITGLEVGPASEHKKHRCIFKGRKQRHRVAYAHSAHRSGFDFG